jgi:hypothetical protein
MIMTNNFFALIFLSAVLVLSACGGGKNAENLSINEELFLENLVVEGYDIDFDPEKTGTYEATLEGGVDSVVIAYSGTESNATLYVQKTSFVGQSSYEEENDGDITLSVDEGANYFQLVFVSSDEQASVTYLLNVYRPTDSTQLHNLAISSLADSRVLTPSPEFQSDHYEYEVDLGYQDCAVALATQSRFPETRVKVGEEILDEGELAFAGLGPGRSYIDVELTSELGSSDVYTIEFNRAAPSDSQLQSNAHLSNIEIDNVDFDFYCGISDYLVNAGYSLRELALSFNPEVEGTIVYVDGEEVAADEVHRIAFDEDSRVINVLTESLNGLGSQSYSITVYRASANQVTVSSSSEILEAIANARPRDEIIVAAGEYHFSSDQLPIEINRPGAVSEKIVLRAEDFDNPVVFYADDEAPLIMDVSVDHWRIQSLVLSGATTQLRLQDTNKLEVNDLTFDKYQAAAILLGDGNFNVSIRESEFMAPESDSGQSIQVQSSRELNNLLLHHNTFHSGGQTSLELSGTASVDLRFNRFYRELDEDEGLALIQSESSMLIAYNHFDISGGHSGDHLIQLNGDENSDIYQNIFELQQFSGTVLTNLGSGQLLVESNDVRPEGSAYTFSQGQVNAASITPLFQIALADDASRCLGLDTQEVTENDEQIDRHFMVIAACDDASSRTHWQWKAEDGHHVRIENLAVEDQMLTTHQGFYSLCSIEQGVYNNAAYLQEDFGGWLQRWKLEIREGELLFRNRMVQEYGLTVAGGTAPLGRWVSTCALVPTDYQRFQLLPVE